MKHQRPVISNQRAQHLKRCRREGYTRWRWLRVDYVWCVAQKKPIGFWS
jgi:hypothetical protein